MNQASTIQKEWEELLATEWRLSENRKIKKESALNSFLGEKIPDGLQRTLDSAFEKAFALIFEKGTGVIEKTYNKNALERDFRANLYAAEMRGGRKYLRKFSGNADKKSTVNTLLSGVSGIGMGIMGVGLPDIPVFTGMMLKCIYEIALSYGFDYRSETEKYFILLLIEGSVSYGNSLASINDKTESFIFSEQLPTDYLQAEQVAKTSSALSKELLYMKFLQGIPVVGALGGAYDAVFMKQISEYAKIKYRKRFLLKRMAAEGMI